MLTAEYKQENIERVMDATFELCKEIGVPAVNKTNISKKSGLSPKSIQRYFDDKVDMIYKITERIVKRQYTEIMKEYNSYKNKGLSGKQNLELLLYTHNNYVLKRYKDVIFIEEADLFCRHSEVNAQKYRSLFRKTSAIEIGIAHAIKIGLADGSIKDDYPIEEDAHMIAVMCAGLVERLANDIAVEGISVEEAIDMSNKWIERTMKHL